MLTSRPAGPCATAKWLAAAAFLGAGCTAHYGLQSVVPTHPLQWPFAPAPPKVVLVQSLTGLSRHRTTGSVVGNVLHGAQEDEGSGFVLPVAVAVDASGRLAVADAGCRCVHLYVPATGRYLRLTGAREERLSSPVGLAFGADARLYVADSTGRLFAFGPGGELLRTLRTVGDEPLQRPTGLAYDALHRVLYVVDTVACRVHALGADDRLLFSFGKRGDAPGLFNFPTHAAFSATGELWIADSLNFRVQAFDAKGEYLRGFGHHGDGSGDMAMPKGLAVDRSGVVYVVDGVFDNIQLFGTQGNFLLTVGGRGTEAGQFWLPAGAFLKGSELYVCDSYNRRVQVFRITEGYESPAS